MCPCCVVASCVCSLETIWPIFHSSRGQGTKQPVKREQITENSSKAQLKEICLFNWLHIIELDWGKTNIGQSAVSWWWEAKDKERVRGFPSRCDHCCSCCHCCCCGLCLLSPRLCERQVGHGVSLHASLDASSGMRPILPSGLCRFHLFGINILFSSYLLMFFCTLFFFFALGPHPLSSQGLRNSLFDQSNRG